MASTQQIGESLDPGAKVKHTASGRIPRQPETVSDPFGPQEEAEKARRRNRPSEHSSHLDFRL